MKLIIHANGMEEYLPDDAPLEQSTCEQWAVWRMERAGWLAAIDVLRAKLIDWKAAGDSRYTDEREQELAVLACALRDAPATYETPAEMPPVTIPDWR